MINIADKHWKDIVEVTLSIKYIYNPVKNIRVLTPCVTIIKKCILFHYNWKELPCENRVDAYKLIKVIKELAVKNYCQNNIDFMDYINDMKIKDSSGEDFLIQPEK